MTIMQRKTSFHISEKMTAIIYRIAERKAVFAFSFVHNRGHGKFAFYAEIRHNWIERMIQNMRLLYGEPYCAGGLLDHCMETEYGTIKWTSNV